MTFCKVFVQSKNQSQHLHLEHLWVSLQTYVQAYIHGSDVVLIGFSDFLHDLHLSLTTAINTSFDGDGSLLVVQ